MISCAATTLTQAERAYAQCEPEVLAIIFTMRKFHKYVYDRQFNIMTDSLPVKLIFDGKDIPNTSAPRFQQSALFLTAYDFQIIYTKKVELAEFLSCLPLYNETGDSEMLQQYIRQIQELPLLKEQVMETTDNDIVFEKVKT